MLCPCENDLAEQAVRISLLFAECLLSNFAVQFAGTS